MPAKIINQIPGWGSGGNAYSPLNKENKGHVKQLSVACADNSGDKYDYFNNDPGDRG